MSVCKQGKAFRGLPLRKIVSYDIELLFTNIPVKNAVKLSRLE